MSPERRAELEAKGAVVTTVSDFLGLDAIDEEIIELRRRLAREVKHRRESAGMTQAALAGRLGDSPSRIPGIESSDSASLEATIAAFFATGGTMRELAAVVDEDFCS